MKQTYQASWGVCVWLCLSEVDADFIHGDGGHSLPALDGYDHLVHGQLMCVLSKQDKINACIMKIEAPHEVQNQRAVATGVRGLPK